MISHSIPLWKKKLRQNFSRIDSLLEFLQIPEDVKNEVAKQPHFSCNVPFRLASKIAKGNINDPLFKQFVPLVKEELETVGFVADPVGDFAAKRSDKLLQKYEGRALVVTTSACAMHCRYCFRQNFDYAVKRKGFEEELKILQNDPSIQEIILSGGDPLSLDDAVLKDFIKEIELIGHVKRIRFHTRFPIGIPERIDASFLSLLEKCSLQIIFVVHINHVNELDEDVLSALKAVQKLGIPVFNQAVLLKGVNDDFVSLKTLFERLVNQGIMPYYLHQLDPVIGTSHFYVEEKKGLELIEKLTASLSGYAIPKYVVEIPKMASKLAITSRLVTFSQQSLNPR